MKLLSAILFCVVNPAQAQVIVAGGNGQLASPALHAVCRQMHGNHFEDLDSLERVYRELAKTTEAEKISELVSQIKEISSRIRFLAKPEWNSENIPVEITWAVPFLHFFDNSDYLDLKQTVRDAPPGQAANLYRYLMAKPGFISEKRLVKAEYLNSENADILKYFSLKPDDLRDEYLKDRSFLIRLKKNVTALEACQFLKTVLFEVKITYVYTMLGMLFESEKNIFLLYRNEAASGR